MIKLVIVNYLDPYNQPKLLCHMSKQKDIIILKLLFINKVDESLLGPLFDDLLCFSNVMFLHCFHNLRFPLFSGILPFLQLNITEK